MRHGRLSALALCVWIFMSVILVRPLSVQAEEMSMLSSVQTEEMLPPHLIQTVTERDIYEGLLALELLESRALKKKDCEAAYENVKACVVRLDMGKAYGSGVIWKMMPDQIVIVTNKHVLEYWDESVSSVHFWQNVSVPASILNESEDYDIGFLVVDSSKLDYGILEQLQYVHWDMAAYQSLQSGDEMFCVGAGNEIVQDEEELYFYQGNIGDMWQYIDEFAGYMIYAHGNAVPGMSGGGTFDAKGNFIGMISGGTTKEETASVPLPVIIEAFEELSTAQ
ncbi:MAG: trypsin-like peptidase domain-containing protein [Lachnospiraceae bacterium]|nr:trypsin-like peptidase domain-containing protein [Lachnospiraceae bacterium]